MDQVLGGGFPRERMFLVDGDPGAGKTGRLIIRQVDPAQLTPGAFANEVQRAVEKGSSTIIIDSINGYQSAMPEEHFLHAHLHELLAYLNQIGIVTLLVMTQQGLLGQGVTSPIELSYLADTIVLLRYFEVQSEVRQAISVVKRRTGPHERTVRELRLTANGIRVGPVLRQFSGILTGQLVATERPIERAEEHDHGEPA
jgi:circadian clock protein KaiC